MQPVEAGKVAEPGPVEPHDVGEPGGIGDGVDVVAAGPDVHVCARVPVGAIRREVVTHGVIVADYGPSAPVTPSLPPRGW